MRTLFLESLIAAVLIGPAIGFVNEVASVRNATKFEPGLSEAEIGQMRNLPMKEVDAAVQRRMIKQSRWEWLMDSIRYSYFWKHLAVISIVPSSGVFFACVWVGWVEKRHVQQVWT